MAIGLALLLSFRFPDNFDRPYAAVSLQDFWRRWHMTLSRWLARRMGRGWRTCCSSPPAALLPRHQPDHQLQRQRPTRHPMI
jgi:hypothetical protein